MGANFQTMSVPATLRRDQVESEFEKAQDQDRYENGHSYSGGFGMATGLKFHERAFDNAAAADDYLVDAAQKWADAIAVKIKNADGSESWHIGAWCAS